MTNYPDLSDDTDTNPTLDAIADATLAFAIAIVDDSPDRTARRAEFDAAIAELAWMLGLHPNAPASDALAETLALVCGKALAHGTHRRGR